MRACPKTTACSFCAAWRCSTPARPLEALEIAGSLREIEPDDLDGGLLAFDRAIFREKACELAALASLRLGRRDAASGWFAEAFRLAPDNAAYRLKAAALGAPRFEGGS